jgi:hypothetical protein
MISSSCVGAIETGRCRVVLFSKYALGRLVFAATNSRTPDKQGLTGQKD